MLCDCVVILSLERHDLRGFPFLRQSSRAHREREERIDLVTQDRPELSPYSHRETVDAWGFVLAGIEDRSSNFVLFQWFKGKLAWIGSRCIRRGWLGCWRWGKEALNEFVCDLCPLVKLSSVVGLDARDLAEALTRLGVDVSCCLLDLVRATEKIFPVALPGFDFYAVWPGSAGEFTSVSVPSNRGSTIVSRSGTAAR